MGSALRLWTVKGEAHHLLDRWWKCFLAAALLQTCVYIVVSQLPEISTYPLTMGWSETSRYYNASFFFAQRIYGMSTPPTVLHPSRYLMQAVPFLIPDSPLWLHRAWQVFLWMVTPLLTAIILVRRLLPWKRLETWLLIGVSFVYLTIGPVYYHLLVPVMLVLWGFRTSLTAASSGGWAGRWRLLISTVVLLVASAWAGISRLNWFPVPGMLAAALILMERPVSPANGSIHPSFTPASPGARQWCMFCAWRAGCSWERRRLWLLRRFTFTGPGMMPHNSPPALPQTCSGVACCPTPPILRVCFWPSSSSRCRLSW